MKSSGKLESVWCEVSRKIRILWEEIRQRPKVHTAFLAEKGSRPSLGGVTDSLESDDYIQSFGVFWYRATTNNLGGVFKSPGHVFGLNQKPAGAGPRSRHPLFIGIIITRPPPTSHPRRNQLSWFYLSLLLFEHFVCLFYSLAFFLRRTTHRSLLISVVINNQTRASVMFGVENNWPKTQFLAFISLIGIYFMQSKQSLLLFVVTGISPSFCGVCSTLPLFCNRTKLNYM